MGMFDYVRCQYPLPVAGANDLEYQTKDTPAQDLDHYEIHADGSLWHQVSYEPERWEFEPYSDTLEFYTDFHGDWLEFSATFKNGTLQSLEVVRKPSQGLVQAEDTGSEPEIGEPGERDACYGFTHTRNV